MFVDDDEGYRSFNFTMAILDTYLEDYADRRRGNAAAVYPDRRKRLKFR